MQAPILEVNHLKKSFGSVTAVNGLSFKIYPKQCFGLLGPNGAGKTTTVELIEGLIQPDSGDIRFHGLGENPRNHTGIQFQSTTLQDFLTVRENLSLFAKLYDSTKPMDELVELCSLSEFLDRETKKLSGGQRQRVALALALINNPKLVFLDEPTMGLDPQARRNFWKLIEDIKSRTTVVLTTHYMEEAYSLCDEIIIIDRGQIVIQGNPKALVEEHSQEMQIHLPTTAFHTPIEALGVEYTAHNGNVTILSQDIKHSLTHLIDQGVQMDELKIRKPTLEDLFIDLTGHSLRD